MLKTLPNIVWTQFMMFSGFCYRLGFGLKYVQKENLHSYFILCLFMSDLTLFSYTIAQGTANRKVAATHMNCESSRSHSVFTCIIESQWEKDSMTHFRFARLNLVDLAGSER